MATYTVPVRMILPDGKILTCTRDTEAGSWEEACERTGALLQGALAEIGLPVTYRVVSEEPEEEATFWPDDYSDVPF